MARLQAVLATDALGQPPVEDVEAYARQGHALCMAAECEVLARALARLDIEAPVIAVEGIPSRRVWRCAQTSTSAAGPLRVERTLSAQRQDRTRALCPLELRAGIIEGPWPPLAAKQATWVVAPLTPQEGEELCALLGNMTPSKRSVDRLPTHLSTHWERAPLGAAYGEATPANSARAETLRRTLRDAPDGVEQVINALCR